MLQIDQTGFTAELYIDLYEKSEENREWNGGWEVDENHRITWLLSIIKSVEISNDIEAFPPSI